MRKQIGLIVFIVISLSSNAQWFVDFQTGIALPTQMNKNNLNYSCYSSYENEVDGTSDAEYRYSPFTFITSPYVSLTTGYLLKNKYQFSVSAYYANNYEMDWLLNHNECSKEFTKITSGSFYVTQKFTTQTSKYYQQRYGFSAGFAYQFHMKDISISPYVNICCRFIKRFSVHEDKYTSIDISNNTDTLAGTNTITTKYYTEILNRNDRNPNWLDINPGLKIFYHPYEKLSFFLDVNAFVAPVYYYNNKVRTSFERDGVEVADAELEFPFKPASNFNSVSLNVGVGVRYYFK